MSKEAKEIEEKAVKPLQSLYLRVICNAKQ